MTLRLTGRKRPAHERQGSWQPLKRLKMREGGHEVRVQLSVVAAAAGVTGAAVALQLSCCRQEVRTPAGPLGGVGGRACRAIVAMGGADLHEEETEEEEEGVGKEEQVSVPKRSKRLTITLRRDEGDGSLGFALADNNQVDIPEPNPSPTKRPHHDRIANRSFLLPLAQTHSNPAWTRTRTMPPRPNHNARSQRCMRAGWQRVRGCWWATLLSRSMRRTHASSRLPASSRGTRPWPSGSGSCA